VLVVLNTNHADMLDVVLAISEALFSTNLVPNQDDEAPLNWCRRVGTKAGVYIDSPTQRVYDLLHGKGYTVCQVVSSHRPAAKGGRSDSTAAPPVKQTYKEVTSGLSAAKVSELLALLQNTVNSVTTKLAFLQETVVGVSTSIIRNLDSVSCLVSTNTELFVVLKATMDALKQPLATLVVTFLFIMISFCCVNLKKITRYCI
jgi:hypothetical protein